MCIKYNVRGTAVGAGARQCSACAQAAIIRTCAVGVCCEKGRMRLGSAVRVGSGARANGSARRRWRALAVARRQKVGCRGANGARGTVAQRARRAGSGVSNAPCACQRTQWREELHARGGVHDEVELRALSTKVAQAARLGEATDIDQSRL